MLQNYISSEIDVSSNKKLWDKREYTIELPVINLFGQLVSHSFYKIHIFI